MQLFQIFTAFASVGEQIISGIIVPSSAVTTNETLGQSGPGPLKVYEKVGGSPKRLEIMGANI